MSEPTTVMRHGVSNQRRSLLPIRLFINGQEFQMRTLDAEDLYRQLGIATSNQRRYGEEILRKAGMALDTNHES